MLEQLKKFQIKNSKVIKGGLPEGWYAVCNSDGTHTAYGPNGSSFTWTPE
ncbi:hypothetical protein [uncultured Lacinutrix sp.]|nr:hypothetical protein [uncultured Lacinutrix sp.]